MCTARLTAPYASRYAGRMWPSIAIPATMLHLQSYTIVRTSYVLIALWLTLGVHQRQAIPRYVTVTAFAIGVPLGIFATRVLDVLEYPERYQSLTAIFTTAGSSIYGAFLVVIPFVWLYVRAQGVSPLRFLDGGAPAMALGEAMTRVGCFLNGCCYGVPWNGPWAVVFPRESFAYNDQIARGLIPASALHSLPVHPVQLYSMAIMGMVFVILLRLVWRPHRDGVVFFAFLVAYGALRLGVAPFRQEALESMKLFSIAFVIAGTIGLVLTRQPAPHRAAATVHS